MEYPYEGITSHVQHCGGTVKIDNNMNESQNKYAEEKKPDKEHIM